MNAAQSIRVLGEAEAPVLRMMLGLFSHAVNDPETHLTRQPSEATLTRLLAGTVLHRSEQERNAFHIDEAAEALNSKLTT